MVQPPLLALAATACYLLAWRGLMLLRVDRAVELRVSGAPEAERRPERSAWLDRVVRALSSRLAGPLMGLLGERRLAKMDRQLKLAGHPDGLTLHSFVARKAGWTILLGVPGVLALLNGNPVVGVVGILAGWFLVDLGVAQEARRRQSRIARDLPDFLDILSVTISAGSGFRASLRRVATELPGPLAAEILTALHQIDLGSSRRAALVQLRERNGVDTLDSFVTSLLQAEELGAPLSQTLAALAGDLRVERGQRLRRRAAEAAPKVSLVVILLLVPATLVITMTAMFIGSDVNLGILSEAGPP